MTQKNPDIPAVWCPCKACEGLRKLYGKDPALLELYGKKLLRQGWAGTMYPEERAYRRAHAPGAKGRAERAKASGFGRKRG